MALETAAETPPTAGSPIPPGARVLSSTNTTPTLGTSSDLAGPYSAKELLRTLPPAKRISSLSVLLVPCIRLAELAVLPGVDRRPIDLAAVGQHLLELGDGGSRPLAATPTVESTIGRPKILASRATETMLRTRRSLSMDVTTSNWNGW